jgi:hypothetical protein
MHHSSTISSTNSWLRRKKNLLWFGKQTIPLGPLATPKASCTCQEPAMCCTTSLLACPPSIWNSQIFVSPRPTGLQK